MIWQDILKELPMWTKRFEVVNDADAPTTALMAIGYVFNPNTKEKVTVFKGNPPFVLASKMR